MLRSALPYAVVGCLVLHDTFVTECKLHSFQKLHVAESQWWSSKVWLELGRDWGKVCGHRLFFGTCKLKQTHEKTQWFKKVDHCSQPRSRSLSSSWERGCTAASLEYYSHERNNSTHLYRRLVFAFIRANITANNTTSFRACQHRYFAFTKDVTCFLLLDRELYQNDRNDCFFQKNLFVWIAKYIIYDALYNLKRVHSAGF